MSMLAAVSAPLSSSAELLSRRLGLSQEQMKDWAALAGLDVLAMREFPSDTKDRGLTVCLWHLGDRNRTDQTHA